MSAKKRALQILIFLLVMFLTFYALFSGRDLGEIIRAAAKMSPWYLIPAVGLALFYVCVEGFITMVPDPRSGTGIVLRLRGRVYHHGT